jgi:general transcription factor 3C polypeptide 3 (transcription factor C subunit 4)
MYAQARPIYEILGQDAGVRCPPYPCRFIAYVSQTSSLHVLLQVATCYHMLGQLQDATEVYETSTSQSYLSRPKRNISFLVLSLDPFSNDVKMRLAGIYEVLNEPRKALDLVYQGVPDASSVDCTPHI